MSIRQFIYCLCITLLSFFLFFISLFLYSNMKSERKEKFAKYRYLYIVVAYVIGYILYFYGIWLKNSSMTGFNRVLYSIATAIGCTAKMVLGGIDTGAVSTALSQSWYLICYSIIHIICFTIAELVVVHLFGRSIINYVRIKSFRSNQGIVLLGHPEKVEYFLRHYKKTNRKVLLLIDKDWGEKEKRSVYDFHVPIVSVKQITLQAFSRLPWKQKTKQDKSILICLYENDRKTINTAAIVRKYLMEHESFNLQSYFNLVEYETTRIVDENAALTKKDGKISFFNKADLVARRFVEKNTVFDLALSCNIHPDTAMVSNYDLAYCFIGFGELGQQLLKKTLINYTLLDCKYYASVFDLKAKELESVFYRRNPGMNTTLAKSYADLHFYEDMDVSSNEFKEKLIQSLHQDNAIFICLKDDLLAVKMALDIKRIIRNARIDGKEIACANIFVHVRSHGDYLKLIAEDKNQNDIQIRIIGANNTIYTYENIIDEMGNLLAKRIDRAYNILKERNNHYSDAEDEIAWNKKSTQFNKDSSRMAASNIKSKLQLIGLDLVKKEDLVKEAASYEEIDSSKLFILKNNQYELNIEPRKGDITPQYFDLSNNNKDYQALKNIYFQYDNPATNLARQEHKRWNLFHLINGWNVLPYQLKKDEDYEYDSDNPYAIVTKDKNLFRHMDILSWEDLKKMQDYQIAHLINKYGRENVKQIEYNCDVLKFDYFTMFGLSAILENSSYVVIKRLKK